MNKQGRWIGLSPVRRMAVDMMHAAHSVPIVPMERRMHLGPLVAARRCAATRIGWCAIFVKALALVAAKRPELRRAFLSLPWDHLYEHFENVSSIAVERQYEGEDAVVVCILRGPERRSLVEIQAAIDACKNNPLEENGAFRRALRVSRLPRFARRLIWWLGLNLSGLQRARCFGTFAVSATAALGASQLSLHSPLTTTLYYGPFDEHGSIDVRIAFDHRVVDGAAIARALADLEETLLKTIHEELTGAEAPMAASTSTNESANSDRGAANQGEERRWGSNGATRFGRVRNGC